MAGRLTRMVLLVTFVCMVIVFGFRSVKVNAARNIRSNDRKFFTSYVVEKDDTLLDIAEKYMSPEYHSSREYVNEIVKSNHLEDTSIVEGQLLILPYYADSPIEL